MSMRFFRKSQIENLAVTMPGVKLGDRVLVAGCSDPKLVAALAAKTGLTGRACAADESAERSADAARVALAEGALLETITAPLSALPVDDASFDIVVLRDVLLGDSEDARVRIAQEAWRVLRPGGRCVVIQSMARSGLGKLLRGGSASVTDAAGATRAMEGAQFRGVRTLAERDGLAFVEGTKPVAQPPRT
jgi:ubiquinone/menaquinone biosynthesis C-methylase UbiE